MDSKTRILVTPGFEKKLKKLPPNAKGDLDKAIGTISLNPLIGEAKKGDLSHVRVYKFKMVGQLTLLAYSYDKDVIKCLALGSHENFYRDLKRAQV
ncbi:MAG: hypothetical protein Ta2A_27340 [Treponemataceae bacterium]|nr:MAG: hypothetical protein Ta2A_27340 [Treponemataceae bacterium]